MEDPSGLVGSFADSQRRFGAYQALVAAGTAALPALREGLRSDNWQVRRWSAICLDHVADSDALEDLLPLLEDPKSEVRLWAAHSLACNHCKTDVACSVDVFPYLVERITTDPSLRVRKMAVIMLATDLLDARAVPILKGVLRSENDRRVRLHASEGLERARLAGMVTHDD
jgi:HEAT repeat protein